MLNIRRHVLYFGRWRGPADFPSVKVRLWFSSLSAFYAIIPVSCCHCKASVAANCALNLPSESIQVYLKHRCFSPRFSYNSNGLRIQKFRLAQKFSTAKASQEPDPYLWFVHRLLFIQNVAKICLLCRPTGPPKPTLLWSLSLYCTEK